MCNFRRRSFISGLSLRSVWSVRRELRCCLRVENESPAPLVTLVSIPMTQPPAHPARLGPTLTGWNVRAHLWIHLVFLSAIFLQFLFAFFFCATLPDYVFSRVHPPACKQCPAGTEPTLGYEYKWWNVLPANMKTSCFNVGNSKCDTMNGGCLWQCLSLSLCLILKVVQHFELICLLASLPKVGGEDQYRFCFCMIIMNSQFALLVLFSITLVKV